MNVGDLNIEYHDCLKLSIYSVYWYEQLYWLVTLSILFFSHLYDIRPPEKINLLFSFLHLSYLLSRVEDFDELWR